VIQNRQKNGKNSWWQKKSYTRKGWRNFEHKREKDAPTTTTREKEYKVILVVTHKQKKKSATYMNVMERTEDMNILKEEKRKTENDVMILS